MKSPKTVREIVADWLKEHGYGGLCSGKGCDPCGCSLDDLAPCGGVADECQPAYRNVCDPKPDECDGCEGVKGGDCFSPTKDKG